jgi:Ca2+-binding RTX toxin-like protein
MRLPCLGTDAIAMPNRSAASRAFALAFIAAAALLLVPMTSSALAMKCDGKKVTIMGTAGNDHLIGKKASDVIYGGGGDDVITGGANGNDTICGGAGDDTIHGGSGYDSLHGEGGNDKLDGETGSDMLDGGAGDDTLSGEKGGDSLHGGSGDDHLTGFKGPDKLDGGSGNDWIDGQQGSDEIEGSGGDDQLLGDKGNDSIFGGPGADQIEGGPGDDPHLDGGGDSDEVIAGAGIDNADGGAGGNDIVRGDNGTDTLSGGAGGNDIVSYSSASRGGIDVNLGAGSAKGDGHDNLTGFEDVVGSPQPDTIIGNGDENRLDGGVGDDTLESGGGSGEAFGGPGSDECVGFTIDHSCGPEAGPPPGGAYVILNQGLDGSSLVIQGSPEADDIHLSLGAGGWTVTDTAGIAAGDGCLNSGPNTVVCGGAPSLSLIVATGGTGSDEIVIEGSVPAGAHVRVNGNAGGDTLVGGNGDDVLEAGENYNGPDNGNDTLVGNAGSDVLYADPGADNLSGGPGNDLLVNSVATCQGHTFDGGPGEDTVSYARSDAKLQIAIGGTGSTPGCGTPDQVLGDNESLEGSDGPDTLIGDNGDNSMLGHLGADTFIGKGGSDFIDALDGHHDKAIDCGGGGDELLRDGNDPKGTSCN